MSETDEEQKCSCTPKYDNMPRAEHGVTRMRLVCSHGMSHDVSFAELIGVDGEVTVGMAIAYAVSNWMSEDVQGEHLKGFVFDWDSAEEWVIRMTDAGPVIEWNRCDDAEEVVDDNTVKWAFHSAISLYEWTQVSMMLLGLAAEILAVEFDEPHGDSQGD